MNTQSPEAKLKKDILDNYKKDGIIAIATRNNAMVSVVRKLATELGTIRNTDKNYEYLKNSIIDLYISGDPCDSIAIKYNLNRKRVSKKLIEWGIQLKSRSESSSIYTFDKTYFKKIDTDEKAYWLGFIYADGCLSMNGLKPNRLSIALCIKDRKHLEKFANAIKSNKPVYDYPHTPNFKSIFVIDSLELAADLSNLGVHLRKTQNLLFPTEKQVPRKFLNSFILGFFDGDGCISYTKNTLNINIAGTEPMIRGIDDFFIENGISETKYGRASNKENGIFYIRKGTSITYSPRYKTNRRKKYLEQIYALFYSKNPSYCLLRKKYIFEKLLKMRHGNNWEKHTQ